MAINALRRPFSNRRVMNGRLMNWRVAPTNCMVLMVKRFEYIVRRTELFIRSTEMTRKSAAKTDSQRLMARMLEFISSSIRRL